MGWQEMRERLPEPGSWIWIREQAWRVERARRDRSVVRLDVAQGTRALTFLAPFDRPVTRPTRRAPMRTSRQEAIARLCAVLAHTRSWDTPAAARTARVDLLPHQLEPVLAVRHGRRRLLLADAVGLGKTIQAGLILADLRERTPALRALLLVPAALVDQWTHELRTRFDITAALADREGLAAAASTLPFGDSPWSRPNIWLATADFIKQPHVFDTLPLQPWDLLILDEAHTLVGASDRHAACDDLAKRARHVLLLTATPHAGDVTRYERLIGLGRHRHDDDGLTIFRRSAAEVGLAHRRVVRWHRVALSHTTTRVLTALRQYERAVGRRARPDIRDQAQLLLALFRKRAVSTLEALDRSLARRQRWLQSGSRGPIPDWRQPSLSFGDEADASDEDWGAIAAESGLSSMEERTWMRRLRALTATAVRRDDKLLRLAALIGRTSEPVVIFTEYRDSLEAAASQLSSIEPVAILHGGLDAASRRSALARFLHGDVRILIATDVGGQGLNLQARARWVINLEVPWNPIRLEQRIGRVDRIGQTRQVHATMLVADDPTEAAVLARVARRAVIASRALDGSSSTFVPPAFDAIVAAVLTETPADLPTTSSPIACREFARRARAHVRYLVRQRALQARWRGATDAGRVRIVPNAARDDRRAARRSLLLLVTVTLDDAAGVTIERQAFLVKTRIGSTTGDIATIPADSIAAALETRLHGRLRRVRRALAEVLRRRLLTERAIGAHLRDVGVPESTQLGLFSRAASTSHDARQAALAAELRAADGLTRATRAATSIHVAATRIEVAWRTS